MTSVFMSSKQFKQKKNVLVSATYNWHIKYIFFCRFNDRNPDFESAVNEMAVYLAAFLTEVGTSFLRSRSRKQCILLAIMSIHSTSIPSSNL